MNAQALHELRHALSGVNQEPPDAQETAMDDLQQQYAHSCALVELGPDDVKDDYPAFAHCFDLHKNPIILENKEKIFSSHGYRYPEKYKWEWSWSSFYGVAYHFMERVAPKDIQDDDVVVYLAEPHDDIQQMTVIHMGKVKDGKITSKWGHGKEDGSSTNVWSHNVDHVPDTYEDKAGNISVAYFRPDRKEIAAYFLRGCEIRTRPKHTKANAV
ncbi:hypothetical protein COU78_00620 [Candidatus Peregrinibacteria bacterium CG10_big_fil_rev_8_21_14_0_10_49_24]|nr:MAG: hypothetical protein COV83_04720 [Candidatus Peregrinibacteria bacterium CG11_big_fil_rev_8_21_14_0_20_49_14]PIR51569.1 MAG: hypothetical protein COU78_00620 [Candidatus Peregrinibacteria bacterium CG10_big_fil_rev_8_21_14_0_10_49_24]PJA67949.1 MAG: hypothetical protein CO157_01335 [Candidatus Peregrinibacteria bacterium CG_4_9_14_3_um_filter_49_12]